MSDEQKCTHCWGEGYPECLCADADDLWGEPAQSGSGSGMLDALLDIFLGVHDAYEGGDMVVTSANLKDARQAIHTHLATAVQDEREICAKIADEQAVESDRLGYHMAASAGEDVATQIRARSTLPTPGAES